MLKQCPFFLSARTFLLNPLSLDRTIPHVNLFLEKIDAHENNLIGMTILSTFDNVRHARVWLKLPVSIEEASVYNHKLCENRLSRH